MATKKLTDKQIEKVKGIVTTGVKPFDVSDALDDLVGDPASAPVLKAAKKILASNLKAIDKALAIVCPPAKAKE